MRKPKQKEPGKKSKPQVSSWEKVIKPNLQELIRLYANGATKDQLAKYLGIGLSTLYDQMQLHPELSDGLARARMKACDEVRGAMFKCAVGYQKERVRSQRVAQIDENGKVIKDKNGKTKYHTVVTKELIDVEPNPAAQLAFLKNCGGWSDNPVLDNAIAKSAEADVEARRKILESLGVFDGSKPRSTERDLDNRDQDVVSDSDLDAMGA